VVRETPDDEASDKAADPGLHSEKQRPKYEGAAYHIYFLIRDLTRMRRLAPPSCTLAIATAIT